MPLDVALATCANLPEPDADLEPLLDALRAAGLSAEALAWDDPCASFAGARATLLRSTWNYSERLDEFLAWVDRTAAATALYNPRATVRWNAHKRYLLDLQARGIPVVPTVVLPRGDATPLAHVAEQRGWTDVVVKPAVSGGSRETLRVRPGEAARGEAHLRVLVAREDVLLQPYLPSVEGHGERAIVTIEGTPTHAVRKSPRFIGDAEHVSEAVAIEADEARLAAQALAAAPEAVLYGRVDVARDGAGRPCVMELELIEPSLFFTQAPDALRLYVDAVVRRLGA
jgi:glutathione synthase/RimK-type ligase-like ATP-grasp enzyme